MAANNFSIPVQKESPVYQKSPLMQTIFRVEYDVFSPLSEAQRESFHQSIFLSFPKYEKKFPDVMLQNPNIAAPDSEQFVQHVYRSDDETDQIEILSPSFTFWTLRYGSWEQFKEKTLANYHAFHKVFPAEPARICLRFVNFLPDDLLLRDNRPLKFYVNPLLCGPVADLPFLAGPVTEYSGNLEWMINEVDYIHMAYGSGFIPDTHGKKKMLFYIDTAVFGFDNSGQTLSDRLDLYHNKAYDAFRWSITEELNGYFNA